MDAYTNQLYSLYLDSLSSTADILYRGPILFEVLLPLRYI